MYSFCSSVVRREEDVVLRAGIAGDGGSWWTVAEMACGLFKGPGGVTNNPAMPDELDKI
jgi:hypothetical protein